MTEGSRDVKVGEHPLAEAPPHELTARARGAYYGWRIVAAAFTTQAITWGFRIHVFGLFLKSINEERGWAPAATSAVFSVSLMCSSLLGPVIGRVVDRRGPRAVMLPGAAIAVLGMLLLSQVQEIWQFYLIYGVVYGVGETLLGQVPATTVVSKWFARRRGTALGIVAVASSVGGMVMLPLSTLIITQWGWRFATLVPVVLIVLLAVPAVSLIMRRTPEDMGLRPDGEPAERGAPETSGAPESAGHPAPAARAWTLSQAMRTPAFWCLGLSWGLGLASGYNYSTYIFSFVGEAGVSTSAVAGALSVVLFFALPSRFLYGWLSDRLDKRLVMMGCEAGLLVAYLSLTRLGAPVMLYLSLVFCAFAAGALQSVPQSMAASLFGRSFVGSLLGTLTLIVTLIVAVTIPLTGLARQQTGSYDLVYYAFPAALLVAMGAIYFARPLNAEAKRSAMWQ